MNAGRFLPLAVTALVITLPLIIGGPLMAADKDVKLRRLSFASLPGWQDADHRAALAAFRRSCEALMKGGMKKNGRFGGRRSDWFAPCAAVRNVPLSRRAARAFFEEYFTPVTVLPGAAPGGLFTGYYEPEVEGSLKRDGTYRFPLHGKPGDLVRLTPDEEKRLGVRYGRRVDGEARKYFNRRQIETGALDGRGLELAWLKSRADRFFMQVQGSGRVRLREGGHLRLAFAAKTGHPFTGPGKLLIERGIIPRREMSMQAIRKWLKENPKEGEKLLWENESYVFFRPVRLADPRLGAYGAQGVQLAPLVSLAVDWRYWAYGSPVWLDTTIPGPGGKGAQRMRRLMVAQDTGTAIRGAVRGDVYFGFGDAAGARAGRMKYKGFMAVLLPNRLAARLLSPRK